MASISNRYASAVHSSNLKQTSELNKLDDQGQSSDADILGAMGIADRRLSEGLDHTGKPTYDKHPLSVPLERMFAGDARGTGEIVDILAIMVHGQAVAQRLRMTPVQDKDMARACLAWYRNGTCRPCGGHGKTLIPGTKTHSDHDCQVCRGAGKMPFTSQFRPEQRELARWLVAELERELGRAGPAAMKALASSMELKPGG